MSEPTLPDDPPYEMANLFADLVVLFENVESAADPDPIAVMCSEEGWGYLEYLALALASRGYTLVQDPEQCGDA